MKKLLSTLPELLATLFIATLLLFSNSVLAQSTTVEVRFEHKRMQIEVSGTGTTSLYIPIIFKQTGRPRVGFTKRYKLFATNYTTKDCNGAAVCVKKIFQYARDIFVEDERAKDENTFTFPVKVLTKNLDFNGDESTVNLKIYEVDQNGKPINRTVRQAILLVRKVSLSVLDSREYDASKRLKLKFVDKVEQKGNILSLTGSIDDTNLYTSTRKIALNTSEPFTIKDTFKPCNWGKYFFKRSEITLTSAPIRFKYKKEEINLRAQVVDESLSLGINLSPWYSKTRGYRRNGTSFTKRFGAGVLIAPTIIDLDSTNTKHGFPPDGASKQLFISTGITISYSYNGINFLFVPLGIDFALPGSIGRDWKQAGRGWTGIGIGVDPKVLSRLF